MSLVSEKTRLQCAKLATKIWTNLDHYEKQDMVAEQPSKDELVISIKHIINASANLGAYKAVFESHPNIVANYIINKINK